MKYIEFFDQYSFLFSFGYTVIVAILTFIIQKVYTELKKYKVKRCLSLKRKECKIILPIYNKKLHNKREKIPMCPIGDIKAATNIIDLIYTTGLHSYQQSIIYENVYFDSFENYNIFCIGGSLANHYSYDLFKQFFPKFKIYASENKIKTNPNNIPASHFVASEIKKGFCWGDSSDEEFLINYDERYAILIKLTNEDFHLKNHGTVHILFGNGVEGTLAISKYLLYNCKDLYKRVKGKKHYFVVFKIKRDTGIINPNSFIDLTNKMFLKDRTS